MWRRVEKHMARLLAPSAALFEVEGEIVFEDVVAFGFEELLRCAVDGLGGPFELKERADGRLVEFEEEALGPIRTSRKAVRRAVFFVTEPAGHTEAFEDLGECGGVRDLEFEFVADLVTAARFGFRQVRGGGRRALEGKDGAGRPISFGSGISAWRFGAHAEELTVFREATLGRVEDDVLFVDAATVGRDRASPQALEDALQRFSVAHWQFDFSFARHGCVAGEMAWLPPVGDFR